MRLCVCVCVCVISVFTTDFINDSDFISFMAQRAEHEVIPCQIIAINGQGLVSSRID